MLKTILGNFQKVAQSEGKFPVDAETMENFQSNSALTAALGAALGRSQVILSGCTITGNRRAEGYVYVKLSEEDTGDVLYFAGGNSNEPNCYVSEEKSDIIALGETYPEAYTTKTLSNGLPPHGEKKLLWSDFVTGSEIFARKEHSHKIEEVINLSAKLSNLEKAVSAPAVAFVKGMIMMWGGAIKDIPRGWHLCDGTAGTVDLRDKFIVGAGSSYGVGSTGGENSVRLSTAQMPSHTHSLKHCSSAGKHYHFVYNDAGSHHTDYAKDNWCAANYGSIQSPSSDDEEKKFGHTDYDGEHTHSITLYETGGNAAHENRPPFYALAYIQYIGE